jgi:hypothetical protein
MQFSSKLYLTMYSAASSMTVVSRMPTFTSVQGQCVYHQQLSHVSLHHLCLSVCKSVTGAAMASHC